MEVYKTVGQVTLNMYIVHPRDHKPTDRRAAIVFLFGGGFTGGSPRQFAQHCEYFASRGMVTMAADEFLASLGCLTGEPTIGAPANHH